jgi:hypothetical protein
MEIEKSLSAEKMKEKKPSRPANTVFKDKNKLSSWNGEGCCMWYRIGHDMLSYP